MARRRFTIFARLQLSRARKNNSARYPCLWRKPLANEFNPSLKHVLIVLRMKPPSHGLINELLLQSVSGPIRLFLRFILPQSKKTSCCYGRWSQCCCLLASTRYSTVFFTDKIRRRWQPRKRRLKLSEFAIFQSLSWLFHLTYFVKCKRTLLELNS